VSPRTELSTHPNITSKQQTTIATLFCFHPLRLFRIMILSIMESFPTFHDPAKFPAFSAIPLANQESHTDTAKSNDDSKYNRQPFKYT
jgi:hypothetical protein